MKKRSQMLNVSLVVFLTMMLLVACASSPNTMMNMTPKQQAAWINNVYSRQYDLYLDQILKTDISSAERLSLKGNPRMITQDMLRTNFTESEAKVLKTKKDIFVTAFPLLVSYNGFISSEGIPPVELEYQLVGLMNRLLALTY